MIWFNPWLIIGILVALLGAAGGGYWKGHRDADRSAAIAMLTDEIKVQLAQKEELRRQAEAAQEIGRKATERELALRAELQSAKNDIDTYLELLASEPAPPPACRCNLSPADAERLRNIALPRAPASGPAGRPGDVRGGGAAAGHQGGR